MKKQTFHHGDLARTLQRAALKLIADDGIGSFTLRRVAERAGVSHPALYRHFASKEALLAALAKDGFAMLRDQVAATIGLLTDPLDQLHAIGEAYVRFALGHRVHFRLMYGPELARRSAHKDLEEASRAAFMLLLEVMRACQSAGRVRDGDPIELALSAWSLVHGLSQLIVDRQIEDAGFTGERAEHLVRTATQMLRDGLEHRARAPRPPSPPATTRANKRAATAKRKKR